MNNDDLAHHLEMRLDALRNEFAGHVDADSITAVGLRHFEHLRRDATINDFIPQLVHRFAREELLNAKSDELHSAA
jgi:hypothetical protein